MKTLHDLQNLLFLDIETVSESATFSTLNDSKQNLWRHKAKQLSKLSWEEVTVQMIEDFYEQKAAIYAEFGRIVCISVGIFIKNHLGITFKTKSFTGENEVEIIFDFLQMVKKHFNNSTKYGFCGHNIREFDIPYICRRALINGITLPKTLDISGKKAWQLNHFYDTLQMWKFGDYKHYTSLSLLCEIFNIPSPKLLMDGSQVGECFWKRNEIDEIANYCEQDVKAVAMLYSKMSGVYQESKPLLETIFQKQIELT